MIVDASTLKPGDVIAGDYEDRIRVTILRDAVHTTETVMPLAGRPVMRYWARRSDTGAEGYMDYGPGGVAWLLERAP